jgi:hypothetical protein
MRISQIEDTQKLVDLVVLIQKNEAIWQIQTHREVD